MLASEGQAGKAGEMNSTDRERELGEKIAKALWAEITLERPGSFSDRERGIDGWLNGKSIQIKYDRKILETRNIYDEYWEKTKGHPEQTSWRQCRRNAKLYIFTTGGEQKPAYGIMLTKDALEIAEWGRHMQPINPTSLGYIIPIHDIEHEAEIRKLNTD